MSERNLKSSRYRVAGVMAAVFLAALWVGCTQKDDKKGQTDTDTVVATLADPGLDEVPGANPNRTRAYLLALNAQWRRDSADTATLECEDSTNKQLRVPVLLYTHRGSYQVDAEKDLDRDVNNNRPGHIIMKVVNRGTVACPDLKLEPDDSVYLWGGKTAGKRAFAVFKIDAQGNATGVSRAYSAFQCRGPAATESKAHTLLPAHCNPGESGPDTLYVDPAPTHTFGLGGPLHDQGLWYACPGGCCQATSFGKY